jgi:enediyne biosynthesis protein E3
VTTVWGRFRRRILTPNVSATSLAVRGFHVKSPAAQELLETIGRTFLDGYGYAAAAATPRAAEEPLEQVPGYFRGFAYEGAAMGFAVRDALPFGGGGRVAEFLAGRGRDHVYMAYVGIGWAMARVPRFRWPDPAGYDPLLRWLVLDGYGFHQAYFRTQRYVREHYQEPTFPWPGDATGWYANRAIDQGIGRALWFVGGTAPDVVADLIDAFPDERRADLYSGAGLAATYAGGADEAELRQFWQRAGTYQPQLAQASAFAAEARVKAGLVVPHTRLATQVFCRVPPERAAEISAAVRPDLSGVDDLPAYEVWRQRIAIEFVSLGR